MKTMNASGLTILTILLVFLWTDRAHAHGLPLFLLPLVGSIVLFPLALFSALLGWLAKGLYFLNRTSTKSLSMIGWSDALKEAGVMYGCFIVVAFVLDLGMAFTMGWSRWWEMWGLIAILAVTTVLSSLATRFLHRRFLKRMDAEEARESLPGTAPWSVVPLGLISPAIFSSITCAIAASRL